MKVTTDGCLFGAWVSEKIKNQPFGKLRTKVKSVLDMGSGTGLLSLMLAQKNPNTIIDAIEIDKEAYEQAKENIAASPWKDQIDTINADAKTFSFTKKYDVIISNPPFYENELKSGSEKKNVAHHSSDLSLNDLFTITKNLLTEKGKFYFLFPYKRKEEIEKSLATHSLFIKGMTLVKQSTEHDYFRLMIEGGLEKSDDAITKEISIRDSQQQYTKEFTELLKDYYLNL